jgi:hypothetical protein
MTKSCCLIEQEVLREHGSGPTTSQESGQTNQQAQDQPEQLLHVNHFARDHHQGKKGPIRFSGHPNCEFAMYKHSADQLIQVILDHWSASENGVHYRRDVSLGEDASRISGRNGAYALATLRNLLLGLFELQKHRGQTKARTFPGWRRKLTGSQKIQLLTQKI